MYPDVLFIDCTYKTNKYNMPLCIFSGVIACNKSFYIGFAFLWHEDKEFIPLGYEPGERAIYPGSEKG